MEEATLKEDEQCSVEIGMSAKGEWYVKSIKVYHDDPKILEDKLRKYAEAAKFRIHKLNGGI